MFVACLLAASLMQALPAQADDYTDIWWAGSAEDGWGVNFIQSQDFIFATFSSTAGAAKRRSGTLATWCGR
jgi:hypothetical protein